MESIVTAKALPDMAPAELSDSFQAALFRHVNVRDYQVCRAGAMPLHALPAIRSQDDLVASTLEGLLQHRPHVRFVIYDKDSRHRLVPKVPVP
jgi:hypothetical protein